MQKCSASWFPILVLFLTRLLFEMNQTKVLSTFHKEKLEKLFFFLTCILPDYLPHEITKEFWKNSHFKNMTAGFVLSIIIHIRKNLLEFKNIQENLEKYLNLCALFLGHWKWLESPQSWVSSLRISPPQMWI